MRKLSIYFSAIILLGSSSSTVLAMQGDGSSELFSSTIIHPESDEAPAQVAGEDPTAPNWKKDGVDWEKEYVPNNDKQKYPCLTTRALFIRTIRQMNLGNIATGAGNAVKGARCFSRHSIVRSALDTAS